MNNISKSKPNKVQSLILALLLVPLFIGSIIVYMWYDSATTSEDPYDEIFIEINSYMPEPIRAWGCKKVLERFKAGILPPHTCKKEDL